jgi:hypothetical protein
LFRRCIVIKRYSKAELRSHSERNDEGIDAPGNNRRPDEGSRPSFRCLQHSPAPIDGLLDEIDAAIATILFRDGQSSFAFGILRKRIRAVG